MPDHGFHHARHLIGHSHHPTSVVRMAARGLEARVKGGHHMLHETTCYLPRDLWVMHNSTGAGQNGGDAGPAPLTIGAERGRIQGVLLITLAPSGNEMCLNSVRLTDRPLVRKHGLRTSNDNKGTVCRRRMWMQNRLTSPSHRSPATVQVDRDNRPSADHRARYPPTPARDRH